MLDACLHLAAQAAQTLPVTESISTPGWSEALIALASLAALEIVLGIDNVVFIAILTQKLPKEQQRKGRLIGLALAALGRIVLLFAITWIVTLDGTHLFELPFVIGHGEPGATTTPISVKDLILLLGGLFLVGKATWEIHESLEGHVSQHGKPGVVTEGTASFGKVLTQVLVLDLVFSIDSVLTAVGMVQPESYQGVAAFPGTTIPWIPLAIMITAIVLAIVVMISFAGPLARFISAHPTMKMLALSFLLMIGMILIAEAFHVHIPRGYIYAAMGFSVFVQLLNLKLVKKPTPLPGQQHPVAPGSVEV